MSKPGVADYPLKRQALQRFQQLLRITTMAAVAKIEDARQRADAQAEARRLALAAESIEDDLADLDRIRKSSGAPRPVRT